MIKFIIVKVCYFLVLNGVSYLDMILFFLDFINKCRIFDLFQIYYVELSEWYDFILSKICKLEFSL